MLAWSLMSDEDDDDTPIPMFAFPFGQMISAEEMEHARDRMSMEIEAHDRDLFRIMDGLTQEQLETLRRSFHICLHNPNHLPYMIGKLDILMFMKFKSLDSLLEDEDAGNPTNTTES